MAMHPLAAEASRCLGASIGILSTSNIPFGTRGRARVDGYWYNQQIDPNVGNYDGVLGTVWAQVAVEKIENGTMRATAYIEVATAANHSTWDEMAFHVFSTTPQMDMQYPVSIELDEGNSELIMKFADETFVYPITTPIYPVAPGTAFKSAKARIQSGPGLVQSVFDDAVYCPDNPAGLLALSPAGHLGGEGEGHVNVRVFRVGGSSGAVSVDYATVDDSATAGADYTATSGTLFWTDGDTTGKQVAVPIPGGYGVRRRSRELPFRAVEPAGRRGAWSQLRHPNNDRR
ncbi:MAG: hypothetical protein M5U09_19770 [Gammaproteobacteria bacterium]|nr:hypothetical protein [Gammaproteobacteria bacterium]